MKRSAAILGIVFLLGCSEWALTPVRPCTTTEVRPRPSLEPVDTLDLLFMIDDSSSMAQEQSLLRAEIPRMVRALAEGDRDADGRPDFRPLRSMHIGVITSDLGAGDVPEGETVPSCDPGLGDDGILRTRSRGFAGCMLEYPSGIFAWEGEQDAELYASEVGCVADTTGGCGFEQQLEATLKALSPASPQPYVASFYEPPSFYGGTGGHGDGANAGFLRSESVLAIVLLTDEEDCSVPSYEIFYPNAPRYAGNGLNLRCERFDEDRYPVERYVAGFRQLRESPGRLVFAVIAGVPTDLVRTPYETMLADERLQMTEDTSMEPALRHLPSCDTANGIAFPPRRMIEVARGLRDLGVGTTVQSICGSDFGPGVDAIVTRIADALSADCLPRALRTAPDGTVGCELEELLPEGLDCASLGLEGLASETQTVGGFVRELCAVPQVRPGDLATTTEPSWWYDDASAEVRALCATAASPQRIALENHAPPYGTELRLRCIEAIVPAAGATGDGTFCVPFSEDEHENPCSRGFVAGEGALSCDPLTRSCGIACTTDRACAEAGLVGYTCDLRTLLEAVGGDARRVPDWNGDGVVDDRDTEADGAPVLHGYCARATCP